MKTIKHLSMACGAIMSAIVGVNAIESASTLEIRRQLVFTTPIVWVGSQSPAEGESAALLEAIHVFGGGGVNGGMLALESFLSQYPSSAWSPSLRSHLAEHYRNLGRFTLALSHWEAAWNSTKDSDDAGSREIAARVLAGWSRLLASLGRVDQLETLFAECKRLGYDKSLQAFHLQVTQTAMETMKRRPGDSYRCGSLALSQIMHYSQPTNIAIGLVRTLKSPDGGFCMSDLAEIAATNGLFVTAVRRKAGGELIVPSVVHWQLNHYAAILEKKGSEYLVIDPTFGGSKWMSEDTINAEASGAFIISTTNIPSGWIRLTQAEAKLVKGKGYPNDIDDGDDDPNMDDDDDCPPPPPDAGDGPAAGGDDPCPPTEEDPEDGPHDGDDESGMPRWRVSEPYISLWLHDTPLFYKNSGGRPVRLRLTYNHRADVKSTNTTLGGFGSKWECNWLGFLEWSTNSTPTYITNYLTGGGRAAFAVNGAREYKTARVLSIGGSGGGGGAVAAESAGVVAPSGSENLYGTPQVFTNGIRRLLLTNRVDRWGRKTSYNYQSFTNTVGAVGLRVFQVTDKDGRQCSIAYTNTAFPHLITSVTDPYSRTAHFFYDLRGWLTNITDMAGMASSFKYDQDGSITNLHTPYGDTSFRYFWGANYWCPLNRAIEITEPNNAKQLFVYRDLTPGEGGGVYDEAYEGPGYYPGRNSFHWNRAQYAAMSPEGKADYLNLSEADCRLASLKRWLHGDNIGDQTTVIGTLSGKAGPTDTVSGYRVNTVAFKYTGQTSPPGFSSRGSMRRVSGMRQNYGAVENAFERNEWGRPTEFHRVHSGVVLPGFTNIFNADGRRLEVVYGPQGELVRRYGYDASNTNLLVAVTNALGEVLRYTYDGVRVTSITLPSGLITTNTYYDAGSCAGFLKTRIDVGFRTNSFNYSNGNRVAHTNELGLWKTFSWDNLNRHTSTTYPDGTTVSNVYDKLDLVARKDRLGNWTRYVYNNVRQLTAVTNANFQVTLYDYCDCGSLSTITKLNGGSPLITQIDYDLAGRKTSITYPDGYQLYFAYEYNKIGPARVEDSSGLVVHYGYDADGNLAATGLSHEPNYYYPEGYLVQREFNQYGQVERITDRNGVVVTNAYDILGRLTNRVVLDMNTRAARGSNTFAYTPRGLANTTDELGHKTWYVRDALGRLLAQTNANNEVMQFNYNPAGEMLALTDGKNQTTMWNYDQYGRVTNKLDAVREVFRYKYDPNNLLTNRWSVAKGETFYGYDPIGNLTNVDYPGSLMDITMQYDWLNRLTNVVDLIGTTKFVYTAGGLLLGEDGPWASDNVSYNYDARRRTGLFVSQPNASDWVQGYGYDQYNRLSNIVSAAGSFTFNYWYVPYYYPSYGGTLSDRVQSIGLPGKGNIRIESQRDELARLTSTGLRDDIAGVLSEHGYEYNNANQRTRQTISDGSAVGSVRFTEYTYDAIGQLKTAKGTDRAYDYSAYDYVETPRLHEQFGYAYDAAWNLSWRTNNALVQSFGVNNLNELTNSARTGTLTVAGAASQPRGGDYYVGYPHGVTNVSVSGTGLSSGDADLYADGSWARTNATLANGNNTYTAIAKDSYDRTATDSVTVNLATNVTFQYDWNGNLTNDGRRVFEYDFENQLTNVYVDSTWRSEFKYDAFGRRRIRKEYGWSGSAWALTNEVRYVYDGMLPIQERDANNLALVSYTRGNDLSGSLQGAGGIGGLLGRTDHSALNAQLSTANAYYHADGNGNITALVNTNGVVVARYNYDPYGNLLGMSGPMAEANTYRFSSKEYSANVSLYYYGFRFYDPNLQRWLNRDPIQEIGGLNLYSFSANDPVQVIDLFGLEGTNDPTACSGGSGGAGGQDDKSLKDFAKEVLDKTKEKLKDDLNPDTWPKKIKDAAEGAKRAIKEFLDKGKVCGSPTGSSIPHPGTGILGAGLGGVTDAGQKILEPGPSATGVGYLIKGREDLMNSIEGSGNSMDVASSNLMRLQNKSCEILK